MDQLATSDEPAEAAVAEFVDVMIDELRLVNAIRSPEVERALRRVPRWRFAPGTPLEQVYNSETAVITKKDEHGVAISSVSAPRIQAFMLEQADIKPGMRVLEIGSGGYNAALLAELVGPSGHVTTIDVDPEVITRADECLRAAGYDRVEVVCGDASTELPGDQWDRIVVTVGAWDIPQEWTDHLAEGGRIVVPLRMRGITRSLALELDAVIGALTAVSAEVCGFVHMQGAGSHEEDLWLLRGTDIGLRFDDANAPDDVSALDGVLTTQRHVRWTGVTIKAQVPFDALELLAAAQLPHSCLLAVAGSAGQGLLTHGDERRFRIAHVYRDAFAYLVTRPIGDGLFEFGAAAFGSHGADEAAAQLAYHIHDWDALSAMSQTEPSITIWPAGTPDDDLPEGVVIDKQHRRIVLGWSDQTKPSTSEPKE